MWLGFEMKAVNPQHAYRNVQTFILNARPTLYKNYRNRAVIQLQYHLGERIEMETIA